MFFRYGAKCVFSASTQATEVQGFSTQGSRRFALVGAASGTSNYKAAGERAAGSAGNTDIEKSIYFECESETYKLDNQLLDKVLVALKSEGFTLEGKEAGHFANKDGL